MPVSLARASRHTLMPPRHDGGELLLTIMPPRMLLAAILCASISAGIKIFARLLLRAAPMPAARASGVCRLTAG